MIAAGYFVTSRAARSDVVVQGAVGFDALDAFLEVVYPGTGCINWLGFAGTGAGLSSWLWELICGISCCVPRFWELCESVGNRDVGLSACYFEPKFCCRFIR